MNRREFAKLTALGATAALPKAFALNDTKNAQAVGKKPANERINVALIGARNIGGKTHLPSLAGSSQCQLAAVCDVDDKVREEAISKAETIYAEQYGSSGYKGIKGYRDFRSLLQRDDIDAVLIATPDHWHVPISKAAVQSGKDVYVEKPLSLDIKEGRELANLLKTHPSIVQVGSQQRSQERFIIACEMVRNGLLGDIRHVEVSIRTRSGSAEKWEHESPPGELDYEMWVGPAPWTEYNPERVHYNFRFVPAFSGGEITNWGAHYLGIAQMGLGMDDTGPVSIRGMGERNPVGSLHTTYFDIDVDFEYANGVTMKLKTGPNGVTFFGTRGQLYVNRGKLETSPASLIKEYSKDLKVSLRKTKGGHLENWFSCIRSRKAEDLHAPVEVGHRSATVCHMANIAIELGRPLYWDAERESFIDDAHATALANRPAREPWSS